MIDAIKQAVIQILNSEKLSDCMVGTVASVNPLKIAVSQKLVLSEKQLVLCREVTDYTINMTVNHEVESAKAEHCEHVSESDHNHGYLGTKSFLVHKALGNGEKVLLIRASGGQKYYVTDRVVG